MKFTTTTAKTAIAAAGIAAVSLFGAAAASATPGVPEGLGTPQTLVDGALVTDYTVSNLQPASVTIPGYTPAGQLWQADVTARANSGVVTPVVSNFNARAGEQNYRVISAPATPQGLSPAPITQGGNSTGKLYFDVTGAAPNGVVYNDGVQDVLVWDTNPAGLPAPNSIPGQQPNTMPGQQPNTMPGQPNTGQPNTMPGQPNTGQSGMMPSEPIQQS
ncbi:MPT63 family protein [Mycobacterium camsae]|uniref:MPT63 family protein n=1 Tax=Mycobacterium gordonae TaxID=1778 RepID=UPI001981F4FB|nr:MPT63 family protein [Mycobacterium gordonae]